MKDGLVPTTSARPPSIGPTMAPAMATPNAVPRTWPRRSRGATTVSQASAPAQTHTLATPWAMRDAPRSHGSPASANATLETLTPTSPATTAPLGPIRCASMPAGHSADDGAEPERRDEETGARVREPELVGVARDQRRERDEQHRVDEQDRADQDEEAPHEAEPSPWSGSDTASGVRHAKKMHRVGGPFVRPPD